MIPADMPRLDMVDRKHMLWNAVRMARKPRRVPLWVIVRDVCSVGAHSAMDICEEMGWNPHQPAGWKIVEQ